MRISPHAWCREANRLCNSERYRHLTAVRRYYQRCLESTRVAQSRPFGSYAHRPSVVAGRRDGVLDRARCGELREVPQGWIGPGVCEAALRPDVGIPVTWVDDFSEHIGN